MTGSTRLIVTMALFTGMLALVVARPRRWSEAWWTVLGAAGMIALGLVSPRQAIDVTLAGKNALLFLLSLLVLSLLVGKSGFFDWAAIRCARVAKEDALALPERVRARRDRHRDPVARHHRGHSDAGDRGPRLATMLVLALARRDEEEVRTGRLTMFGAWAGPVLVLVTTLVLIATLALARVSAS